MSEEGRKRKYPRLRRNFGHSPERKRLGDKRYRKAQMLARSAWNTSDNVAKSAYELRNNRHKKYHDPKVRKLFNALVRRDLDSTNENLSRLIQNGSPDDGKVYHDLVNEYNRRIKELKTALRINAPKSNIKTDKAAKNKITSGLKEYKDMNANGISEMTKYAGIPNENANTLYKYHSQDIEHSNFMQKQMHKDLKKARREGLVNPHENDSTFGFTLSRPNRAFRKKRTVPEHGVSNTGESMPNVSSASQDTPEPKGSMGGRIANTLNTITGKTDRTLSSVRNLLGTSPITVKQDQAASPEVTRSQNHAYASYEKLKQVRAKLREAKKAYDAVKERSFWGGGGNEAEIERRRQAQNKAIVEHDRAADELQQARKNLYAVKRRQALTGLNKAITASPVKPLIGEKPKSQQPSGNLQTAPEQNISDIGGSMPNVSSVKSDTQGQKKQSVRSKDRSKRIVAQRKRKAKADSAIAFQLKNTDNVGEAGFEAFHRADVSEMSPAQQLSRVASFRKAVLRAVPKVNGQLDKKTDAMRKRSERAAKISSADPSNEEKAFIAQRLKQDYDDQRSYASETKKNNKGLGAERVPASDRRSKETRKKLYNKLSKKSEILTSQLNDLENGKAPSGKGFSDLRRSQREDNKNNRELQKHPLHKLFVKSDDLAHRALQLDLNRNSDGVSMSDLHEFNLHPSQIRKQFKSAGIELPDNLRSLANIIPYAQKCREEVNNTGKIGKASKAFEKALQKAGMPSMTPSQAFDNYSDALNDTIQRHRDNTLAKLTNSPEFKKSEISSGNRKDLESKIRQGLKADLESTNESRLGITGSHRSDNMSDNRKPTRRVVKSHKKKSENATEPAGDMQVSAPVSTYQTAPQVQTQTQPAQASNTAVATLAPPSSSQSQTEKPAKQSRPSQFAVPAESSQGAESSKAASGYDVVNPRTGSRQALGKHTYHEYADADSWEAAHPGRTLGTAIDKRIEKHPVQGGNNGLYFDDREHKEGTPTHYSGKEKANLREAGRTEHEDVSVHSTKAKELSRKAEDLKQMAETVRNTPDPMAQVSLQQGEYIAGMQKHLSTFRHDSEQAKRLQFSESNKTFKKGESISKGLDTLVSNGLADKGTVDAIKQRLASKEGLKFSRGVAEAGELLGSVGKDPRFKQLAADDKTIETTTSSLKEAQKYLKPGFHSHESDERVSGIVTGNMIAEARRRERASVLGFMQTDKQALQANLRKAESMPAGEKRDQAIARIQGRIDELDKGMSDIRRQKPNGNYFKWLDHYTGNEETGVQGKAQRIENSEARGSKLAERTASTASALQSGANIGSNRNNDALRDRYAQLKAQVEATKKEIDAAGYRDDVGTKGMRKRNMREGDTDKSLHSNYHAYSGDDEQAAVGDFGSTGKNKDDESFNTGISTTNGGKNNPELLKMQALAKRNSNALAEMHQIERELASRGVGLDNPIPKAEEDLRKAQSSGDDAKIKAAEKNLDSARKSESGNRDFKGFNNISELRAKIADLTAKRDRIKESNARNDAEHEKAKAELNRLQNMPLSEIMKNNPEIEKNLKQSFMVNHFQDIGEKHLAKYADRIAALDDKPNKSEAETREVENYYANPGAIARQAIEAYISDPKNKQAVDAANKKFESLLSSNTASAEIQKALDFEKGKIKAKIQNTAPKVDVGAIRNAQQEIRRQKAIQKRIEDQTKKALANPKNSDKQAIIAAATAKIEAADKAIKNAQTSIAKEVGHSFYNTETALAAQKLTKGVSSESTIDKRIQNLQRQLDNHISNLTEVQQEARQKPAIAANKIAKEAKTTATEAKRALNRADASVNALRGINGNDAFTSYYNDHDSKSGQSVIKKVTEDTPGAVLMQPRDGGEPVYVVPNVRYDKGSHDDIKLIPSGSKEVNGKSVPVMTAYHDSELDSEGRPISASNSDMSPTIAHADENRREEIRGGNLVIHHNLNASVYKDVSDNPMKGKHFERSTVGEKNTDFVTSINGNKVDANTPGAVLIQDPNGKVKLAVHARGEHQLKPALDKDGNPRTERINGKEFVIMNAYSNRAVSNAVFADEARARMKELENEAAGSGHSPREYLEKMAEHASDDKTKSEALARLSRYDRDARLIARNDERNSEVATPVYDIGVYDEGKQTSVSIIKNVPKDAPDNRSEEQKKHEAIISAQQNVQNILKSDTVRQKAVDFLINNDKTPEEAKAIVDRLGMSESQRKAKDAEEAKAAETAKAKETEAGDRKLNAEGLAKLQSFTANIEQRYEKLTAHHDKEVADCTNTISSIQEALSRINNYLDSSTIAEETTSYGVDEEANSSRGIHTIGIDDLKNESASSESSDDVQSTSGDMSLNKALGLSMQAIGIIIPENHLNNSKQIAKYLKTLSPEERTIIERHAEYIITDGEAWSNSKYAIEEKFKALVDKKIEFFKQRATRHKEAIDDRNAEKDQLLAEREKKLASNPKYSEPSESSKSDDGASSSEGSKHQPKGLNPLEALGDKADDFFLHIGLSYEKTHDKPLPPPIDKRTSVEIDAQNKAAKQHRNTVRARLREALKNNPIAQENLKKLREKVRIAKESGNSEAEKQARKDMNAFTVEGADGHRYGMSASGEAFIQNKNTGKRTYHNSVSRRVKVVTDSEGNVRQIITVGTRGH